jgi:hypothetical protein
MRIFSLPPGNADLLGNARQSIRAVPFFKKRMKIYAQSRCNMSQTGMLRDKTMPQLYILRDTGDI